MKRCAWFFCSILVCLQGAVRSAPAASAQSWFRTGVTAYNSAHYDEAAQAFEQSARLQLASGTLQNWGNAEWKANRTGPAILAWEQSLWINPFQDAARNNLRFARKQAQLEAPELKWYEVVSSWLPANWWAWLAGVSLWLAVLIISVPGILGRPRTSWQQAAAAIGFMVFLLSIPAHFGVSSRARIGLVLAADTPLRLTPTAEAQLVTRLPAGQPARYERRRGDYLLIRAGTHGFRGWIDQKQFGLICR